MGREREGSGVFDTVELYLQGLIEKTAAIARLRFLAPNNQIALRSQALCPKDGDSVQSGAVILLSFDNLPLNKGRNI